MVKTRTSDWIGANCRNAESFKPLARRAMASHIGDVYYVDLANGTDAGDGDSWAKAFLTFNHAIDEGTAYNNDYFLVKGWKTETGTGVIATLDVGYTHWLGAAGIMNPYYPEKGTLYRSGAGDAPHTLIDNEFIEVGGFAINAKQSTGTESSSVSKGALRIGSYTGATTPNKAFIHNIMFADWNVAANTTGMTLSGCHYPTLRDITIDNVYGNFDSGIYIHGSSTANCAYGTFEDIHCQGGVAGAFTQGIKLNGGTTLQNSRINGLWIGRTTNAIALGGAGGGYCTLDNAVAGCAEAVFFAGGSACDARNDLWTNYKWTVGNNVAGNDNEFQAT